MRFFSEKYPESVRFLPGDSYFLFETPIHIPGGPSKSCEVYRIVDSAEESYSGDLLQWVPEVSEWTDEEFEAAEAELETFVVISTLPNSMPFTCGPKALGMYLGAFAVVY